MNNETLERLLIDRTAGELTPDVEELLEAHLQQNPEAQEEAVEIEETLRLARLALVSQTAVDLPSVRPAWRIPTWAWGMAACLVGGLVLGILAGRTRNGPTYISASVYRPPLAAVKTEERSGFWLASRLRPSVSSFAGKAENRIIWKSPLKKPEMF